MKSRILFAVTNDLSYDQRMIRICSTLAEEGFKVTLIGRKRPSSVPLVARSFQQKRLYCFFQKGKWFYLEFNLRLFFHLLFSKAHILCAIDLDTILPVLFVSEIRKKIRVYDAHEYFTEVPEVVRRPVIQKIWAKVADWAIPKFEHCYTVGECLAHIFQDKYGPTFKLIRNVPFLAEKVAPLTLERPFIILYQGVLNEGRGLEFAIEAMQSIPGAQLWLAGEGDLSFQLKEQVKTAQLEDKIKFLGYLSPEVLKEVTLQAHLGLNLLENKGLSYFYSLANKAFDYIQAGLPSIQMDFPEYRKLQEEYGVFHLLKTLDPSEIATTIKQLKPETPYYEKLRKNCLKAKQELHWGKEKKELIQLYKRLAKQ